MVEHWNLIGVSCFCHRAFTGEYLDNKQTGLYKCVVCGEDLFDSKTKYKSGCGWPSFYDNLDKDKVKLIRDSSFGMIRTEVVCAKVIFVWNNFFDIMSIDIEKLFAYWAVFMSFLSMWPHLGISNTGITEGLQPSWLLVKLSADSNH